MILFNATDVSTTTIVRPGPVIDFLLANQDIKDVRKIDWGKVSYGHDVVHFFSINSASPRKLSLYHITLML
jgi:hypothetical protein